MVPSDAAPSLPNVSISSAVRVLKKRPSLASGPHTEHTAFPLDVTPLRRTLQRLSQQVQNQQTALQKPALERIVDAVNFPAPPGQFPAVCVDMGTSSVAGDSSTFHTIVAQLSNRLPHAAVKTVHPARHDSLRVIASVLETPSPNVRLVVAVEHAHLFHPDLLSDLVYLLYHKAHEASVSTSPVHATRAKTSGSSSLREPPPVAAVFALPHANALHEALSVRDAATLSTTLVRMPAQCDMLDAFVETLSTRPGVICTAPVFNLIESHFFTHDMSLVMLVRSMRQFVTLHYISNPLAPLIDSIDSLFDQSSQVRTVSNNALVQAFGNPNLLSTAKNLPSAKFLSSESPASFVQACRRLGLWKLIANALQRLAFRLDNICHSAVVRNIQPNVPSGAQSDSRRVVIFKAFLPTDVPNANPASVLRQSLCSRARKLNRERLQEFFTVLAEELEQFPSPSPQPDQYDLPTLLDQTLYTLKLLQKNVATGCTDSNAQDHNSGPTAEQYLDRGRGRQAKGGNAASQRRRQQLDCSLHQSRPKDAYHQARDQLESLLRNVFNLCPSLQTLPLYEILLYSNVAELSRASGGLNGATEPRSAIFTGLRQPSQTLDVALPHKVPDIAIAFRILAEGGRLVSLYDWFNSFASSRTAACLMSQSNGSRPGPSITSAEMQARFARACAELEFLGILKYTNRKTDHVARLAFE